MSSNKPVDSAAVVSEAPLGEARDNDDEPVPHELQQADQSDEAPDDAGDRAEAFVAPSGADPPDVPEPMPGDLAVERPPADAGADESDQMGGEAPTG